MKLTKRDYLFYIAISLLITIFIVYVFRYSCKCRYRRNEGFQNNISDDNSFIKKTTTYKKIFSESSGKYSIWEPETMPSYYPMAHVYQKGTNPPQFPSYLLKASAEDEASKPKGFLPICKINDNMAVWVPHCREGYSPVGMIFSKDAPSIHKFRCIRKEHTDDIVLENAFFNSSDIQLWKIKDSQFFIGLNLMNMGENKIPRGNVRRLLPQKLKTECDFDLEMTKDYKEIGTMKNEMTKKIVSLWRPIAPSGYVSLGDIALEGYQNPNGVVETPIVKYSQSSPPLHFGKKLATIEIEQDIVSVEKKEDDTSTITPTKTMSVWKPVANKGYGSVGCIITEGEEEPETTSIIGCIPLDMVKTVDRNCQKVLNLLWNNEPIESSKALSFWTDPTNRLHVNKQATLQCVEMEPLSILDPDSLLKKIEKPQAVLLMSYERLDTNTSNYTFSEKIRAIQTALSKLGNTSIGTFQFLGKSEKQKSNSIFRFGVVGNNATSIAQKIVLNAQTREMENKPIYVSHTKSKRSIGSLKELRRE